jgi:cytosol alanyl aminopeptidase
VRHEAAQRGRAYLVLGSKAPGKELPPELLGVALKVAAEEGGSHVADKLIAKLATEEGEMLRRRILSAIGSSEDPELAARARELELDARVHPNEVGRVLASQIRRHVTRDQAWAFFGSHLDKMLARMPPAFSTSAMAQAAPFCDQAHADDLERLFKPRAATIEGGPRALAAAVEDLHLCIARRAAHEAGARAFFAIKKKASSTGSKR